MSMCKPQKNEGLPAAGAELAAEGRVAKLPRLNSRLIRFSRGEHEVDGRISQRLGENSGRSGGLKI